MQILDYLVNQAQKQAKKFFFGSEVTASVTHPVGWRDTKIEHLDVAFPSSPNYISFAKSENLKF